MSQLENLLQQCTVKLTIPNRRGWGTGFFVAPEWILTCAHVVQEVGQTVQVRWQNQENWAQAVVERSLPEPYDLALLRITLPANANPPCVYLDEVVQSRDLLYLFGYPDQDFSNGCPVTLSCEGLTGDEPALIKFALGQVRPGMSGSALLNQQTGKVCGIVKFTRDRSTDLGGGAISTHAILEQFLELKDLQREFHESDRQWSDLVLKRSNTEMMSQTNSGSTKHQTQAADSTIFHGGTHVHNNGSSQAKQAVKKILLLAANPENADTSRRRKEARDIRDALKRAKHGDLFVVDDGLHITAAELSEELSTIQPYIVNISGHANGIEGLVLENNLGSSTFSNPEKLIADLFRLHTQSIQCIILNGCYSAEQTSKIVLHIEFIIGINQDLEDIKINAFLIEFYYQIGLEQTIKYAYESGCNRLARQGLDEAKLPVLLNKHDEIRRRELEGKLSSCDKKIKQDQDNVELWKNKASLLKDLGRPKEADEAYERASSLEPNNYEIRTEQGESLAQFGKTKEAVDAYNKALAVGKGKEDYKPWWKKAQALIEIERYDEAVEAYEKAVSLEPSSPDSYVICREYGSVLKKLEQYQKSINLYKKSMVIKPKYRASSYEKRQAYKKMYSRGG